MERSAARSAAARQTHSDWTRHIRAPEKRGRLIHDLIERHRREVGVLHFDDGPFAFNRRADREAGDGVFTDRRVYDATRKFHRQVFRCLECPAKRADILSVNEDAGIIGQRPCLRLAYCFQIGDAQSQLNQLNQLNC